MIATMCGPLCLESATIAVPGVAATTLVPHRALIMVPGRLPAVFRSWALGAAAGKITLGAVEGRSSGARWACAGADTTIGSERRPRARVLVTAPTRRLVVITEGSITQIGTKL